MRSTSRVSTAASTVSIAVPVKRSLAGGALSSLPISKLTSKRPLRGSKRAAIGCIAPVIGGVELEILHVAIEGQREVGGVAEAAAVFQRAGDLQFGCPWLSIVRDSRVTETALMSLVSTPIT